VEGEKVSFSTAGASLGFVAGEEARAGGLAIAMRSHASMVGRP